MRAHREAATFAELLRTFGEDANFSLPPDEEGEEREAATLQVVATRVNREALDILDGDTEALLNNAGRTLAMTQNTWIIEISEESFEESEATLTSTITFRGEQYKSAGDLLTDVGTRKIILRGI